MFLNLHAPDRLLKAFDLGSLTGPAARPGGGQAATGPAEEAVARLPPHMLVDIGLLDEARNPRPAAVLPPVSAMHRRGDWGAGPQSPGSLVGPCWTWPTQP